MFGYIRPFKPYMRFCEYDIYSAFYCGLCKELGKNYGQFFRLLLSYDFAFLGILHAAYNTRKITIAPQRCIAHPLKKRPCLCCGTETELDYASGAAVISVYHKLCDSVKDSKGLKSWLFKTVKLFLFRGYKKAVKKFPYLAEIIEKQMQEQFDLEKEKCSSVDAACEPTAKIMSAIAKGISNDTEQQKTLSGFGYHLGRFIYIADAFDDMEKDSENENYNPFLTGNEDFESAKKYAADSINLTLGMIAEYYSKMDIKRFKEIIDNVIYLGLKNFRLNNKKYLKKLSKENKNLF